MLDRLKRPEIQKIQPLWVDNSTSDWFLVVIQLQTYLDWTLPHSATWVLDRLKPPEIQKIQPLWVDASTTDWFLVVIPLETYLDWTLIPLIPLSDFNVGPAQTSWNRKQELGSIQLLTGS